jgi:hypothetical protein
VKTARTATSWSSWTDLPLSELLRVAASCLESEDLASELRIRAHILESATNDVGGHESSRRSLLVALGQLPAVSR